MKGGLGNIMKQAKAMKDNMKKAQEELAFMDESGESAGGLVKLTMTCRYDVKKVTIAPSVISDDEDREMLEDLITAAVNDALKKVEKTTQDKMSGMTGGMNIPGLNLPF